ncbi:M14 family zinc carboxypeptidase [Nocardia crassostreae]|uniref:M14 family zinc carboxypeptidase n=1 Tax=Nocardia crassostreae TaxID=53428 RepID=UPI00082C26AD|nr:M14 family zinc carboxypeptidase [Nocardia crassostreae]
MEQTFPTVDELHAHADRLAAEYPKLVRISEIGRSRAGEPIRDVQIGSGPRQLVVLGNPHPNEPIGMATIRHLLDRLTQAPELSDEIGATWHFVPCVDPDGTRLNEGWYRGPFTRTHFARTMFRPPSAEQPEWCFPAQWRGEPIGTPMPETRALMNLIDATRPALIASLHNADFGGGFYYTTGGDPTYWSALTGLLTEHGVPIQPGEPDAPGARPLATGVFELPTLTRMCDTLAEAGVDPRALFTGGGAHDYSLAHGTAVLVCELPLWTDPRTSDDSVSDRRLAEVLHAAADSYEETARTIGAVLDRVGAAAVGNPFRSAVTAGLDAVLESAAVKRATPAPDRYATRAEIFTEQYQWAAILRLRLGGMLVRMLAAEAAGSPLAAAELPRFGAVFDRWCAEIEHAAPGALVPLDRLVTVQAAAILTAATRLRDGLPI